MTTIRSVLLCLLAAIVAGCASDPRRAPDPPATTKLIVVLVGGNSEAGHQGGLWKLYKGRSQAHKEYLLTSIRKHTDLTEGQVEPYYFSWTGDDEADHDKLLPSHWNWIFGGTQRIAASLQDVLAKRRAGTQLAIIGWSNGGATAYELACTLSAERPPDLLVTLDPAAWTTKPCEHYSGGRAKTPSNWVHVYTKSGPSNRLQTGNIIALLGRAWDNDKLPSQPASSEFLSPANHGDTKEMWEDKVTKSSTFRTWASSQAR